jgi:hypothetical protein
VNPNRPTVLIRLQRILAGSWVFAVSLLSGCSSDTVNISKDLVELRKMDAGLDSLRRAFIDKSASVFWDRYAPSDADEEVRIRKVMSEIGTVTLEFYVKKMVAAKEGMEATVHWELRWTEGSATQYGRGSSLFWIPASDSGRIQLKEGDNPFLFPWAMISRPKSSP